MKYQERYWRKTGSTRCSLANAIRFSIQCLQSICVHNDCVKHMISYTKKYRNRKTWPMKQNRRKRRSGEKPIDSRSIYFILMRIYAWFLSNILGKMLKWWLGWSIAFPLLTTSFFYYNYFFLVFIFFCLVFHVLKWLVFGPISQYIEIYAFEHNLSINFIGLLRFTCFLSYLFLLFYIYIRFIFGLSNFKFKNMVN